MSDKFKIVDARCEIFEPDVHVPWMTPGKKYMILGEETPHTKGGFACAAAGMLYHVMDDDNQPRTFSSHWFHPEAANLSYGEEVAEEVPNVRLVHQQADEVHSSGLDPVSEILYEMERGQGQTVLTGMKAELTELRAAAINIAENAKALIQKVQKLQEISELEAVFEILERMKKEKNGRNH